jgi:hypothetical protein
MVELEEDMERVTLYTYVCSYLLLKERIQKLYMFRKKISTRSPTTFLVSLFSEQCKVKAV